MAKSYIELIRNRIELADPGTIFTGTDFYDIADSNTVRKSLFELVQKNILRRIFNGVFEKPRFSVLLNEFLPADPHKVALALARTYNWTIAPSGNTALNLLGLSTQVTAVWSFISDGPYKTYEWDSTKIEFKHRTNKEITNLSYLTILVIQALKTLGKDNITPKVIDHLSKRLKEEDKVLILREAAKSTSWVYETIKTICGGVKAA